MVIGQTSAAKEFVVQNRGLSESGSLAISITGANPAAFAKSSTTCGPSLAANASCSTFITFTPGSQANAATLQVTPAISQGVSISATLTGTGQRPCSLGITAKSGSSADFGSVVVNSSKLETFILSNSGEALCESLTVKFSGTDGSMFTLLGGSGTDCGPSLASGAMCELRVQHAPTAPGAHSASLDATTASSASTGVALTSLAITSAGLAIRPDTVNDFGNVITNSSALLTFTVTNAGGQASGGLNVSLAGNAAYSLLTGAGTDCGAALPGNGTCTVRVQFAPSMGGTSSTTLTVFANPGGTVNQSVQGNAQYKVGVSKTGAGTGKVTSSPSSSITCGSTCSAGFNAGEGVALKATPDFGSLFGGWSGDCSGTGGCSLLFDGSKNVVANFTLAPTYNLSVTKKGTGSGTVTFNPPGVSCGTDCNAYPQGTPVTITSTPQAGSYFSTFVGAGCGTTCAPVVNGATTVTAVFEAAPQLWYSFDGTANNTGVLSGYSESVVSATYTGGKFGQALAYGASGYGSVPGVRAVLGTYTAVTVAFWFNLGAATIGSGLVIWDVNSRTTAPYGGVQIAIKSATTASLCMSSTTNSFLPSGSCTSLTFAAAIGTGWHHLALQYAGTGLGTGQGGPLRVYVDGSLLTTISNDAANNPVFSSGILDTMYLGGAGEVLDDLRIYNRTFTAAELCTAVIGGTFSSTCTLP